MKLKISLVAAVLWAAFLLPCSAQIKGDISNSLTLTATCSNSTSTCGATAGSQLMVPSGSFGVASVGVSGTYTGVTLNFEQSLDGDVTWSAVLCARKDSSVSESSEALGSSDKKSWLCPIQGTSNFRVRQSANSTGSPYVTVTLSQNDAYPTPAVSLAAGTVTIGSVKITDGSNTQVVNPCQALQPIPFSKSGTASVILVPGTSAKKTYICSMKVVVSAAQNIAVVEGTGSACGTSTATYTGITGGTTAATGDNLAANSGWVYGTGGFLVGIASTNADDVCALLANAVQTNISGTYVQQ